MSVLRRTLFRTALNHGCPGNWMPGQVLRPGPRYIFYFVSCIFANLIIFAHAKKATHL